MSFATVFLGFVALSCGVLVIAGITTRMAGKLLPFSRPDQRTP